MAIEKYIIDKSDLTALLSGEELAIQPKGNIRGFCVEIAGNLTNGDVIKAVFPRIKHSFTDKDSKVYIFEPNDILTPILTAFDSWWNAPYREEDAE